MASTSALSMTMPVASLARRRPALPLLGPGDAVPPASSKREGGRRLQVVRASLKEKAVSGLTAAAVAAALVLPDIAEAAQPGVSPSLKNFLLSIVSGGVVLVVILGAVIAVANFDPVKRS